MALENFFKDLLRQKKAKAGNRLKAFFNLHALMLTDITNGSDFSA